MKKKAPKNKYQVESILQEFPETRDSDLLLMVKIWETFYKDYIMVSSKTGAKAIDLSNLSRVPQEEDIRKARNYIQKVEMRFLPKSAKIAKKRRIDMTLWRQKMFGQYQNTALPPRDR